MSQVICVRRVNTLLQCTVKKQRKRESRRQKLLQCTLGKRTRESRQQTESHGMVPVSPSPSLNGIRQVRRRTRAKESSLISKAPPNRVTNERKRHGTNSAQEKPQLPQPTQARMGRDDGDDSGDGDGDGDGETSRKRSRMRASMPKYQSRFWKLSQLLQNSDSLWDDSNVPPPSSDCPYNVHVMERTLSLKLVAGFHKEALEFCHDVLVCWYEQAALVECGQQQQHDPPNLQHVRNGIAYMWCLYAQVASRVLNDDSGPSRRSKLLQQLLDVATTSCPLVRNHSAVVIQGVKLEMSNNKWIGDIHCETIQGFLQAVQPHVSGKEERIIQLLSSGIETCNNAVRTFDGSSHVALHRTTNDRSRWNGTLECTLLKSISALGRTVAAFRTKWPPSYRVIDAASTMLICKEANRLSRIKEAILNLEDDCSVSETANYAEDSDDADSSNGALQNNSSVTGTTRGSKCWGVDYACRCFARFETQQELEGHTCREVAPESQGHDDDPTELQLLPNVQVGSRIAVYWACDDQYFEATVTRQDVATKKGLYLEYDDGDCEWVDLREKTFRLLLVGSCSMEDGMLVEYGCKHCPFRVYETKEKLLEHKSVCHTGLD